MAQAAQQRERQSLTIATRFLKPPGFSGTEVAWRSLCDTYPSAEAPEVLLALMEYCSVRRLDPFKRPCHVVPMWNSRLRRRVQVIMQGINEVEITASRTGQWAGMDLPQWGETVERTFRGTVEDEQGKSTATEMTMRYPLWCAVTVYRVVAGERRAFTEQLFWDECYAKAAFRSEVPNARWQQAPRQMLHKCTKAAVLRAAFPEEGLDYTREEMEDREIDVGGIVIDGTAHTPPPPTQEQITRDRQADEAYGGTSGEGGSIGQSVNIDTTGRLRLEVLDEPNGTTWLRHFHGLLDAAANEDELVQIAGHRSVHAKLAPDAKTAPMIREQITDALTKARERFKPAADEQPSQESPADTWQADPMQDLLDEVQQMDAITLASIGTNAAWRARVHAAAVIPQDEDTVREAIEARKLALKGGGK